MHLWSKMCYHLPSVYQNDTRTSNEPRLAQCAREGHQEDVPDNPDSVAVFSQEICYINKRDCQEANLENSVKTANSQYTAKQDQLSNTAAETTTPFLNERVHHTRGRI